MATVSTRLDDDLKTQAEEISEQIGISLSNVINVFLKKFIACRGFPFDVTLPETQVQEKPYIQFSSLDAAIKEAIADPNNDGQPAHFTYLDPKTNKLYTITERK